jgi:hypothetical protein
MHSAARVFYKYWKHDEGYRPILFIIVTGAILVPEISGSCVFEGEVLLLVLDEVSRFAPIYMAWVSRISAGASITMSERQSRFIKSVLRNTHMCPVHG